MNFLLARDTVNGAEGTVFITAKGKQVEACGMKNIRTSADIQSTDMKTIGTRVVQDKPNGAKQTGKGNVYYGSTGSNLFRDMVLDYVQNGIVTEFDIQINNTDPTTTVGNQVGAYYGCHLTGEIPLSILDSDEAMLNYDFNFVYTRVAMVRKFTGPTQLGN